MSRSRIGPLGPAVLALACLLMSRPVAGQGVEISPVIGYGFGSDLVETLVGTPIDRDGSSTFGGSMDVPIGNQGLFLEILYTHSQALFDATATTGAPLRLRASVDYWHVGGIQELDVGAGSIARPFLTGTVGLTRFAGAGDSEVRFSVAAGGGVKLLANRHFGARLEGRVFATFDDGSLTSAVCTTGRCLVRLNLSVDWQASLTSGLVFAF
jgi:hypothetical protein